MRISRLELRRFGKFTDCRLDLPAAEPDLHVIVGPNEAGKSTLRAALADLLFGIDTRTPYNFLHQYADLCIAAMAEENGSQFAFQRRKRRGNSLFDTEDRPLPDDRLAAFLGSCDRPFFERMFALDRRRLEEGGIEILKAKNDLGRMLFEASAGLASLQPLRERLEAEADGLWGPRKKQSRAYSIAFESYEDARKSLELVTVRAHKWKEARKAVDVTEADLRAAIERHRVLEATRARLERVRRVAHTLRRRDELIARRKALGDVALLPQDAASRLDTATQAIAAQVTIIAREQSLIDKAENEATTVVVDEEVLAHKESVRRLSGDRDRVRDHPAGLLKQGARLQELRVTLADLVRQLGWPAADEVELARRIPSGVLHAEIEEQLTRYARVTEAARLSAEMAATTEADRDMNERQLATLPDRTVSPALIAARQEARALGNVVARRSELQEVPEAARRRLAAALAEVASSASDLEGLRGLSLPEAETVQAHARQEQEIGDRLRLLEAQLRNSANALAEVRLASGQIARDRLPPTTDEIAAARAERDAAWADVRDGRIAAAIATEGYEAKVAHADDLADRRYLAASEVQRLEQMRDKVEHLELQHRQLVEAAATLEAERRHLSDAWTAQLPPTLLEMSALAFPGWMQRRRRVLDEADQLEAAEAACDRFERAVDAAALSLQRELSRTGSTPAGAAGAALSGLLAEADVVVATIETAAARRNELVKQRVRLDADLALKAAKAEAAAADLADCTRRLAELRAAAHLSAELGCDATRAAIGLQEKLQQLLEQIDYVRQERIAKMQRDLEAFESSARALTKRLAPDLAGSDAAAIITALNHRLGEAEKAKDRQQRAITDRAEAMKAKVEAEVAQQRAKATLRPLAECAGTDTTEALRVAVARSDEARRIDTAVDEATRQIIEGGDGLSLAALEAEVSAEDLTIIKVRLDELEMERGAAQAARDECVRAKKAADDALAAIDGSAAAAEAEARRQEALADMAAATEGYINAFIAARLLGWAIDRFRAEKQDPLLVRAGDIFRGLTLGSFATLAVDYDGDTPHLMGRRSDGSHVGVDGMSEGTRDQLYLALRLAAIELHIDKGRPLPFIADDLFVNFDDDRAAAGFRALAELAARTQVLFLSHHEHLVDVARRALGEGLSVIAL